MEPSEAVGGPDGPSEGSRFTSNFIKSKSLTYSMAKGLGGIAILGVGQEGHTCKKEETWNPGGLLPAFFTTTCSPKAQVPWGPNSGKPE